MCPSSQWASSFSSCLPSYISLDMNTEYVTIWLKAASALSCNLEKTTVDLASQITQAETLQSKDTWHRFYQLWTTQCCLVLDQNSMHKTVGLDQASPLGWSAVAPEVWKACLNPSAPGHPSGTRHQFRRGCHCPWGFGCLRVSVVGGEVVWCWQTASSCAVMMICEAAIAMVYRQGMLLN